MKSTPIVRRIARAAVQIEQDEPDELSFLHSILCQVGMPRKEVAERFFERTSGRVMMRLDAGILFQGGKFVHQGVPYGSKPRLTLIHLSSEAVKTKSPIVEVGHSARQFLIQLGIDTSGGPKGGYTLFRKQMENLAACRLTLGYNDGEREVTVDTKPIKKFEAWLPAGPGQMTMWPGVMELSSEYFESLQEHAVPLRHEALSALKHSSLCLDLYSWLAHRLCRVNKRDGQRISWKALKEQFGQEYKEHREFRRSFLHALRLCVIVYPEANIELVDGGLLLRPSPPPIARKMITL